MERDPVAHDRKTWYPDDSSPQTDSEFASRRRPFPVRIPAGLFYFSGTERLTLSFIGKCEGLRTAKTILKRTMFQELPFAISTLNYRAEQSAWGYLHEDGQAAQRNGTEAGHLRAPGVRQGARQLPGTESGLFHRWRWGVGTATGQGGSWTLPSPHLQKLT